MLHFETIERNTLDILNGLMEMPELKDFLLVGGTALSLKFGHRKSIDIDLFCVEKFENSKVQSALQNKFPGFNCTSGPKAPGVFGYIDGVKIDLVKYHQYKNIRPHEITEGVRLISTEDIAAMKVAAMLDRPRKKDYWDISLLFDVLGVEKVVDAYYEKIENPYSAIVIHRAFLDYEEAALQADPESLKNETWADITGNIMKHINAHLNTDF